MSIEPETDDPVEIEVAENDVPAEKQDEIVIEPAEKPEKKAEKPKDDIEKSLQELQARLDAEREKRLAAERAANDASQTAHKHKSEAADANLHLITNAMKTIEQSNEILKANLRNAHASSDFDQIAEIQSEMANNAANLARLEQGKSALEAAPKEEAPTPFVSDPVEALASQLSPRSAAWVRSHPEFATDPRKYQAMIAAHQLAVANGETADSDGYFESIETSLRIRQPTYANDDASSEAAKPVQRRQSPPAAPVSRSATTSGGNPNRVTLSSEEREFAKMNGMTEQEYAKNKLALIREGKLN